MAVKPLLVLTCGNPSRGDDALGAAVFDWLEQLLEQQADFGHVDVLTDFQLQVEHAADLVDRERVLFVDASVSAVPPYELTTVNADTDQSYSTHAMSPAAVLAAYEQVYGAPPPSQQLAIRGYEFELGAALTAQSLAHLKDAKEKILQWLAQ